ncbi:hypothetical protein WR25_22475 [Diploscapter pachys]|uniref:Uncharacterized protein n=1 Tax=Diploscapter pachys TaxID=2018661 RepID=A0A2A2M580_9BILA|nr:hypothetical protein WR25_22475 [Diploscapter pachys]
MPSSWNCSRVPTAPWAPIIHSNCAVTSCGRLPTTASKLGAGQPLTQAQGIEQLGAGLADGHRPLRGLCEGLRQAAVVDGQRVLGGAGMGQA